MSGGLFGPVSQFDLQEDPTDPIADVTAFLPWNDKLVIVDQLQANVKVFDSRGALVSTIGRAGDGPGEFQLPVAAAVVDANRLAVFDPQRGVVSLFDESGDYISGWLLAAHLGTLAAVDEGRHLLVAGRIAVGADATSDDGVWPALHVLDLRGRVLKSFGRLSETEELYQPNLDGVSAGVLGRDVILARRSSNLLHRYDLVAGTESSFEVAGAVYTRPNWRRKVFPEPELSRLAEWANRQMWTESVTPVDGSRFLVGFTHHDSSQGERRWRYALVTRSGRTLAVSNGMVAKVHFVQDGRVYATWRREDGGTVVETYALGASAGRLGGG